MKEFKEGFEKGYGWMKKKIERLLETIKFN